MRPVSSIPTRLKTRDAQAKRFTPLFAADFSYAKHECPLLLDFTALSLVYFQLKKGKLE
jgi:hypothetical protein